RANAVSRHAWSRVRGSRRLRIHTRPSSAYSRRCGSRSSVPTQSVSLGPASRTARLPSGRADTKADAVRSKARGRREEGRRVGEGGVRVWGKRRQRARLVARQGQPPLANPPPALVRVLAQVRQQV